MSLPPLDRLRLTRTGEFYPLSQEQVDEFNREGAEEPITQQPFRRDAEPQEGWHTFRVEILQPNGSFKDQFYRAESLWEWYQRSAGSERPPTDPLTRKPIWYEDWWALHERFDPQGFVPDWAHVLTRLASVKRHTELQARAAAWLTEDAERREALDEASEQSNLQALQAQQPYTQDPNDAAIVWTFFIKGSVPEQVVGGRSLVHEMRWLFSQEMQRRWRPTFGPVNHWYERLDISKERRHYPATDAPEFLMHVTRYRLRLRLPYEQARQFGVLASGLVIRDFSSYERGMFELFGIHEARRAGVWMHITRIASFVPADQNEPLRMTREEYEQWHTWSYRLHDDPPAPALALGPPDPADLLTEERAAREQEVTSHRNMLELLENHWWQRIQNDNSPLRSLRWIHKQLTYHEQYLYVQLVRLAELAGGADEAANLRASRWRDETENRNVLRQEHLQAKRGEQSNIPAAIQAAHTEALAAIESIRERERERTYNRRY